MKTKAHTFIRRLLPSLALLLLCTRLGAQTGGTLVNTVIPPSPTSAAFRQFAGYTPSLATGTVNVPVDLYNVQAGDFNIPLSLQYYTQGIKLTDDPYPAGYGWMLTPGLRITRTIMGRPDIDFPMNTQDDGTFDYCKSAVYDEESHKHAGWDESRLIDTQHDIFTVHLADGDYTFLLDKENGTYVAKSVNDLLKIVWNGSDGFEVTDGNGVLYSFGGSGAGNGRYREIYHNRYATAWMLRKVTLPGTGREITFTWEEVRHSDLRFGPFFGGDILKDYKEVWNSSVPADRNPEYVSAEAEGLLANYGEYEEVLHLKRISFPGGTVDFSYKSSLKPLLTDITVKDPDGAAVKRIVFSYGTGLDERLLQRVSFSDEGTYRFSYNATRFSAADRNAQDYWGYYNARNNASLVPRMQIKTYYNRAPGGHTEYAYYGTADRSVDAAAMQAYMLTRVTYPTGGYSAFEYEPHRFQGSTPQTTGLGAPSRFSLTQGGGLRVTRVTSSAGGDAPAVVKTYKYGPGENGLANVLCEPTLDTFVDELGGYMGDVVSPGSIIAYNVRSLFLNPQSNYMRYAFNTPALWYGTVTEYADGGGKTVYTYERIAPENRVVSLNTLLDFPYKVATHYNTLFSRGCLLTRVSHYLKAGTAYSLVQQTTYGYELKEQDLYAAGDLVVTRAGISLLSNGPDLEYSGGNEVCGQYTLTSRGMSPVYMQSPCTVHFYYEVPKSEQTVRYTPEGSLTETRSYTYRDCYLVSKSVTGSDGNILTESYLYPKDYAQAATTAQQGILSAMLGKNIKAPVFQTTRSLNGKSERLRTEFASFGTDLYRPFREYYRQGESTEICRNEYGYDPAGNLQSRTEGGTLKHTWLWGYNRTVPVAFINGLDYGETLSLTGQADIDNLNGATGGIATALGSIRDKIGARGQVSTCCYAPLVGVTEATAPNGGKTSYTYDSQKRLTMIEDPSSGTLQQIAYNRPGDVAVSLPDTAGPSVSPAAFSDVTQGAGTVTAEIVCTAACTIDFYLTTDMMSDGYATFTLNGTDCSLHGTDGESRNLSLAAGTYRFGITLHTPDSGNRASLYITGATNGTGSPSYIEINN